jgi:hypothetical protein
MSTIYEQLKAFGETRERELFGGGHSDERKRELTTSYASLRALIDPKFREKMQSKESFDSYLERSLRHGGKVPEAEELLKTGDASVLWPKVFQDTIIEPTEPQMIGQDVLCDQITVEGGGNTIEWLTTDALVAQFIDEGEGAAPDQLSIGRHMQSTRIRKAMAMVSITEEMIKDSNYDLIGLHLRATTNALKRLKEEWIWTVGQNSAYVVFDNDGGPSWRGATTGIDATNTANQTFGHMDFIDLLMGPVSHGWTPDTIILHPLHFPAFIKDPLLRDLLQGAWPSRQPLPNASAVQSYLPFALTAYLSPFVANNVKTRSAATDAVKASLFVLDRAESLILMTRQGLTVREWNDPRIDVYHTNIRERYGVGVKHKGQAMAVAKGVSTSTNYQHLIQLTKTVS